MEVQLQFLQSVKAIINSSIEKLGFQPTSESVYNSIIGLGLASYYTKHNLLSLARAGRFLWLNLGSKVSPVV